MFLESKVYDLSKMPTAIWLPLEGRYPECYQGTPLEILQQIGVQYEPVLNVEETMETLAEDLDVEFPEGVTLDHRAAIVLITLLETGLAKVMPQG